MFGLITHRRVLEYMGVSPPWKGFRHFEHTRSDSWL